MYFRINEMALRAPLISFLILAVVHLEAELELN